ncbi:MAG: pyridoxal-phosphate dependent enzyme [Flavobacteriaceae bacterium]
MVNQQVHLPVLSENRVTLFIKREDLLHPFVSGNKFRKLKYNLEAAAVGGFETLLTFGGAYSNHIAATAYAGKQKGFKTIGIIRGDELSNKWQQNPTLQFAHGQGMRFKFVSRESYREKHQKSFLKNLEAEFGSCYILPEGGTNLAAVKGCEEILTPDDAGFDVICCCVGTGGTLAGIVNASLPHQRVLGFPAIRGGFIKEDIRKFATRQNWDLNVEHHFGGYGKVTEPLVDFINDFKARTSIPLDPVYTGKMLFGVLEMVKEGFFPQETKILAIHSGGLQGITGMNQMLKRKRIPQLNV